VVNGFWQPGDKIPSENELVSLFAVSRASIRTAIQRLITLGLLESRVGDGTYVKVFDPGVYISELVPIVLKPDAQIEILEFRRALETEALRLSVQRASDEDIRELERIHIRSRKAFKELDPATYSTEDMKFHSQIFKMSKNRIFATTFQALRDVFFPHIYSAFKDFISSREIPSDEIDLHTAILEAIKKRDEKACLTAYGKLMEELTEMYSQFQSRDDSEGK
jgi:GntR family transcriptional repressor for pyruvate dehydrogenase complex